MVFVVDTFNFVASVYGAKATRLIFNKGDCVEFQCVPPGLRYTISDLKIRLITFKFMLLSPLKDIYLLIYYIMIHKAKNIKF